MFPFQFNIIIVARQSVVQRNSVHQYIGRCRLLHMDGREAGS
ncbi:hypothetical protein Barb7_02726 [Bacteroidales bacterium Barb7]|nr:hypothetical protein Barb7_02726 [Bacteroidales bacterium Barb7]